MRVWSACWLRTVAVGLGLWFGLPAHAEDSLNGRWQTISDVSGKPAGIVEIYEQAGTFRGRVVASYSSERGAVCLACPEPRKGQPIVGLEILTGLRRNGDVFSGGEILDPENGHVYRAELRLNADGQKLDVRGYLGLPLFGRTQTWLRLP